MNDHELLILAAKSAISAGEDIVPAMNQGDIYPFWIRDGGIWNPLEFDGDALRLAVRLGLSVTIFDDAVGIGCRELPDGQKYEETPLGDDPYATTRRAIVRAAAEIGKGMK